MSVTAFIEGPIATLTFANPAQRGALTPELLTSLRRELAMLERRRPAVRVVILRGADGNFSSGYAIDRIPDPEHLEPKDEIEQLCEAIESSPLVVLAALCGVVVGAGLDVAAACDIRLATHDCGLGITPAKLGLVYTVRGTARIHRLVGPEWTRRLFFTGDLITGETAWKIGLVSEVHNSIPELDQAATALATVIASRAKLSLSGAKRILQVLEEPDLTANVDAQLHDLRRHALRSPDASEARLAFAERRRPSFGQEDA